MPRDIQIIPPAERPAGLSVLGTTVTVLHRGEDGDVTHQRGAEGMGPPPHRHPWSESFYVLEGSVVFTCDGVTQVAGPGAFVHSSAGSLHGFRYGPGGGAILEFTGPGSRSAAMFAEISEHIPPGPPDLAALLAITGRHGARFAGGPLESTA